MKNLGFWDKAYIFFIFDLKHLPTKASDVLQVYAIWLQMGLNQAEITIWEMSGNIDKTYNLLLMRMTIMMFMAVTQSISKLEPPYLTSRSRSYL